MRHRILFLLILLPILALCACGKTPAIQDAATNISTVTAAPTAAATPSPTPTPFPTPSPTPEIDEAYFFLPETAPKQDGLYRIHVYFGSQSVVAFHAENGAWVPVRTMICSTGDGTPEGTFKISDRYVYHSLFGAKGQYACRITGHYLFHSVPIDENAKKAEVGKTRTELWEYEKLGTPASQGCVRLTCIDAKWIYDHSDKSTVVMMTSGNGPVPTPPPALIDGAPYETEEDFGWDPTDPDENNPYHAVYGVFE